jgi:uncharacterized membrane protein
MAVSASSPVSTNDAGSSTRTRISWPHILLSVAGIGTSLWALYAHLRIKAGGESGCGVDESFNCDAVIGSRYAQFAGIPLGIWGIVFFVLVILVSTWKENPTTAAHEELQARLLQLALSFVGFAGSVALTFVSHFVLVRGAKFVSARTLSQPRCSLLRSGCGGAFAKCKEHTNNYASLILQTIKNAPCFLSSPVPGELTRAFLSSMPHFLSQNVIFHNLLQATPNALHFKRINGYRRVAYNLVERSRCRTHYWTAAGHCFEWWQAETFVKGRKHERHGMTVKRRQVFVVHTP